MNINQVTGGIVDAAMRVHSALGPGLLESAYRACLLHGIIARAFSNEVIMPGKTTNQDVVWWLRQQVNDMGLGTWFQPSVRVQRPGKTGVNLLAEDSRSNRARRCAARRFRDHGDETQHRHAADGLCVATRRE